MAIGCVTSANFSTDPSFWGRLTETEVDISKNIVGGFCQTDFESGVYQLRGRLQELLEMSAVNYTLIGHRTTRSVSHWLCLLQILFKITTSKTVSTWETFSVTCHYVSYIGHRKANLDVPLLTNQDQEQHSFAFTAGFKKSTMTSWRIPIPLPHLGDDLACFNFWQLWRYLHTSCCWSQGSCFGWDYCLYCNLIFLTRKLFNGSCWFWTLKKLRRRTTRNPIWSHTQKPRLVFPSLNWIEAV